VSGAKSTTAGSWPRKSDNRFLGPLPVNCRRRAALGLRHNPTARQNSRGDISLARGAIDAGRFAPARTVTGANARDATILRA